jgi:hypothetical protein
MEPAEQARLLLERASHRLSGGEIATLKAVADGADPGHEFTLILTEFAAYLVF